MVIGYIILLIRDQIPFCTIKSLGFRDRFDILLEKRLISVAELRYKRLYGKCEVNKHTRREFMADNYITTNSKKTFMVTSTDGVFMR